MTPCSLGNSPTIWLTRSALHKPGRPLDLLAELRIAAELPGHETGQPPHAPHLVVDRAQLGLEQHAFQLLHHGGRATFLVAPVEKFGILQARPQHPLVPPDHHRHVLDGRVVDRDEVRQQTPAGVRHGEILLVLAHGGDQHLGGKLQEFVGETADGDRRVLHQMGDGGEQILVRQNVPAHRGAAWAAASAIRSRRSAASTTTNAGRRVST